MPHIIRLQEEEGAMTSHFPKLFQEYYAIHETIHAILREGAAVDDGEIERRVKETHPDLSMGPATLKAAIKQAVKDTGPTAGD